MNRTQQEAGSRKRIRATMRELGEATRPQLAKATGLSLVLVGKVVAAMCAAGELTELGHIASGGGRPAVLYSYRQAPVALFVAERRGPLLTGRLDILIREGESYTAGEALFAILHEQSLDDWLDAVIRRHSLGSIALELPPDLSDDALRHHLQQRYGCTVQRITPAVVLAGQREKEITLALPQGAEPTACFRRRGKQEPCGRLGLLPMPANWQNLDYEDHTLVEEMVARLLLMLTCSLAPATISLHAGFWTKRLTGRIRYNLSAKLKDSSVPFLLFRELSPAVLNQRRCLYLLHPHANQTLSGLE